MADRENGVQVGGDEARVGPDAVDEPPVLALDVDDQGLAGCERRIGLERRSCRPCATRRVSVANRPKISSPTRAQIVGRDAQPGEVDRRVGGAAADIQDQLVDRDQLAGAWQVVERRAKMVGHHQARADDRVRW